MAEFVAAHLVPFALVAFRVAGLMLALPLIGGAVVPVRAKVLLAIALATAVYPLAAPNVGVIGVTVGMFGLVPLIVFEVAIGALIGFLAGMPLHAANFAGYLMGHQMGLTLARTYDPGSEVETDLLSQLLFIVAAGAFLAIGGLEALLLSVAGSFDRLPAGDFRPGATPIALATMLIHTATEIALRVSAPVVGIVWLSLVALGMLSKTLPQINAMTVGFILKIVLGMGMVAAGVGAMSETIVDGVESAMGSIAAWWIHMGGSPA